jgi:hypothetical protein
MHVYNKIHVLLLLLLLLLLLTLSHMFRRLLRHLQVEHYRMLKNIVSFLH